MKLKLFISVLSVLGAVALISPTQAQNITGFGEGDFSFLGSDFTVNTAGPESFFISGSATSTLLGSLDSPVSVSSSLASVYLTATQSSNVTDQFQIGIYDADFNGRLYSGFLSSFTQNATLTLELHFVAADNSGTGSAFNGEVAYVSFIGAGSPTSSLSLTLNNLSAVPEPATAAALLGMAAVGICGLRRRRRLAA